MPNLDYQRHTFLGGEVSPSLYERADMEKFSRWFSKAENIRFMETGGFKKRNGFVKVADTRNNRSGEKIKLLAFSFNDEQSFLVEMDNDYARFYDKNGLIKVNDAPYELPLPFDLIEEGDIKYAQSGDIIFIAHPTSGIYELSRIKKDGTEWKIKKFNTDIYPMDEENTDGGITLSAAATTVTDIASIALKNPQGTYSVRNPKLYSGSTTVYEYNGTRSFAELAAGITAVISSSNLEATINDNVLSITPTDPDATVPAYRLEYDYLDDVEVPQHLEHDWAVFVRQHSMSYSFPNDAVFCSTIFVAIYQPRMGHVYANTLFATTTSGLEASLSSISAQYEPYITNTSNSISITHSSYPTDFNVYYRCWMNTSGDITPEGSGYQLTSNTSAFFDDIAVGECVLVKHKLDALDEFVDWSNGSGSKTIGPTTGEYRLTTTGTWAGSATLSYSDDNKTTWHVIYKWDSPGGSYPHNITLSSKIESDNLVYFKFDATVSNGEHLYANIGSNSAVVNSYYKVLQKTSETTALAKCIKNDVGEFSTNSMWRKQAFSKEKGWPQTIAFYQNRLFIGKDYILYGSKTNDFWDFYEPITLKDDDPISMSLLSQKVNTIKNLVTQRSFFTFTAGGEFGIASEGALTQKDKYLKQFSANGSADCLPVLISDVVLFVDKSKNSIRALKYSLESDGYEAPDITLTLRELLKDEEIMSTDTIFEDKEAFFLSRKNSGSAEYPIWDYTIWDLKYITDQNVIAWSHWKHAFGNITNICVVPNGAKHDLYIAVEGNGGKWIEKLSRDEYMDTVEYYNYSDIVDGKVTVTGIPGYKKEVMQDNKRYVVTIGSDNKITVPADIASGVFKVGSIFDTQATLLGPVVELSNYARSTYEKKNPFKVFFYYLNSYGFKVGVEEDEKMEIEWQHPVTDIDNGEQLTSGKKSVLIPSRFEHSARISFVQNEPYPMEVCDVLMQTDYGGK